MQLQLYGNKIWLYRQAIDFRASIDGLTALIATNIKQEPKSGIYLFFNKKHDKIKCLSWHKTGFILLYKRMEQGKFSCNFTKEQGTLELKLEELSWLLAGLDWQKMRNWRELNYDKFT